MKSRLKIFFLVYCLSSSFVSSVYGLEQIAQSSVENIFKSHFRKYSSIEYYSGAEISVYIPGKEIETYYSGRQSHEANSQDIDASTLFHIGSISKSFTSALILQLEKDQKLALTDNLARWFPKYEKWSSITIKQMLNMTSGLPNYSDTPLWNSTESKDLSRIWTERELINFAYPKFEPAPPLMFSGDKYGYFYTNTGYILAGMIAEKVTGETLKTAFITRLFDAANLTDTYYPVPTIDSIVIKNLASGYNYNQYDDPVRVGVDMRNNNLTWAGAAGGIVSNSQDIIKWVNALFVGNNILDSEQKKKLKSLVSLSTGEPISRTNKEHPGGFGLGIAQRWQKEMGSFWFYEGITLGFRAAYLYKPCNGIIIASIFNSVPDSDHDHIGELMANIYMTILKENPNLDCGIT
ncbi:MAG: serine hydrolase domain-containing protein [Gammaproteobacteria bacterium]